MHCLACHKNSLVMESIKTQLEMSVSCPFLFYMPRTGKTSGGGSEREHRCPACFSHLGHS